MVDDEEMEEAFYDWAVDEDLVAAGPENDDIVSASMDVEIDVGNIEEPGATETEPETEAQPLAPIVAHVSMRRCCTGCQEEFDTTINSYCPLCVMPRCDKCAARHYADRLSGVTLTLVVSWHDGQLTR